MLYVHLFYFLLYIHFNSLKFTFTSYSLYLLIYAYNKNSLIVGGLVATYYCTLLKITY